MTYIKKALLLSRTLAHAGFMLRNEGTYLGIFWYLLNPLLMFALLFVIFSRHLGGEIDQYPLYLLLGIIMFNFFQQAVTEATKVIHLQKWIIKSINFPREAIPGSVLIKALYSHGFELIAFLLFMIFLGVSPLNIFGYIPVAALFALFVAGCVFIAAAITVYIVDFENIWLFGSRLLFFGTPIFYAADIQGELTFIQVLNPLFYYITAARELVIYGQLPELWILGGAVGYAVASFGIGLLVFVKLKRTFADVI